MQSASSLRLEGRAGRHFGRPAGGGARRGRVPPRPPPRSAPSAESYAAPYALFKPREMVELFVAELDGEPLAALMVFAHGRRAWYLYGASTDRERNRMPTYLLQWQG